MEYHQAITKKYELMKKLLKKTSAVEAEQESFLQSLRYAKLPEEEKEARKKENIDDEAQQQEKESAVLSDVSLSGENVNALEEIKKVTERFQPSMKASTSTLASATNQKEQMGNTDTATGSIDLII